MSRLSRILLFTTAVAAVGSMAIVGGPDRARGQAPVPEIIDGVEQAPPASGDRPVDPHKTAEPLAVDSEGTASSDAVSAAVRRRKANRRIEQALGGRVTFQFKDDRLRDVLAELGREGSFPLLVDEKALKDIGVSADEPVTMDLEGVMIEQALNRALRDRGLTWIVQDEVLRVTTIEEGELFLETKVYDVGALLSYAEKPVEKPRNDVLLGERFRDFESATGASLMVKYAPENWLVDSVKEFTSGPWDDIDGTGGTIDLLRDVLVIRHAYHVHREIASLLETLHAAARGDLEHGMRVARPANYPLEDDRRIRDALDQQASIHFRDMPLSSVMAEIARRTGAAVIIDHKALSDIGLATDEPVSLNMESITWRSALRLLLEPLGLTAVVEDGFLVITTIEEAELLLFTVVHDIRDLADREFAGSRLVEVIQNETSGPWEPIDGTGGSIAEPASGMLLVRQTHGVHEEVATLLADLREHALKAEPAAASEPDEPEDPHAILTRFYPVDPLLTATTGTPETGGEEPAPLRPGRSPRSSIERTILDFVSPESWKDSGGPGVLKKVNDVLVVRQTAAVHQELRDFLDRLENAAAVAASLQGMQLQGGGLGSGGFGGGAGFFRVPVPEQALR